MIGVLEKAIDRYILANGLPTEVVSFLGNSGNGAGNLDIDISSGMDCSLSSISGAGTACRNKYWRYEAWCSSTSCVIRADRLQGEDNQKYTVAFQSNNYNNKWSRSYIMGYGGDYDLMNHLGAYFTQN